jgi:hypothetical protein
MRNYRAQRAANNPSHEFKDEIKPEVEIANSIKPEPEIKLESNSEIPVEEKTEADKYAAEVRRADEATERLRDQIAAIDRSRELQQQQQQRAAYANQTAEYFRWWQQNGLKPDDEQFLLANPDAIIPLTNFVAGEVAKQHEVGSAGYFEAGRELFFRHVEHLRAQARTNAEQADQPQSVEEPMPQSPTTPTPAFFQPTPAPLPPRQQRPARSGIVSAPVTRETGLLSDSFDRKQQHTLSAQEVEAAKISGVTPSEYLKQKLKMQQMKANGEIV